MNAKRITKLANGGSFILIRLTDSEARDLAGDSKVQFESALRKLRATLDRVDGDSIKEEEANR